MTDVRVNAEPLTYRQDTPYSYFQDLLKRTRDAKAMARLQRHGLEMDVVQAKAAGAEERAFRQAVEERELEYRTNPNRTQGQGGFFAPPLWLNQAFATAPRPERVLAKLAPQFPLPRGVSSINIPRLTTGTLTGVVADLAADPDQDAVDAQVSSPVVTIAGQGDVSLQLLEQSPAGAHLDWAFFKDLSEDYDFQLEVQMIQGSGSGNTSFLGVTQVSGINNISFTTATPSFSASGTASNNLYPLMGQASAKVGDNRKRRPEAWLMTTSRWSWIATSNDNQGRPIVPPDLAPPPNLVDGGPDPVSSIYGWPVYVDDAIPTNLGVGANQDELICLRPSDLMLFESSAYQMVGMEVLSGNLEVRLRLHRHAAALNGRYPTGISVVSGTGMVVQSGF